VFVRTLRSTTSSAALRVKNCVTSGASSVTSGRRPALAVAALVAAVAVPAGTASAFAATGSPAAAPPAVSAPLNQAVHAAAAAKPAPAPAKPAPAPAKPAPAPAPAPTVRAAVQTDPYASASFSDLEPTGTYGPQSSFTPDAAQWSNAKAIVHTAESRGMPAYAAVIAVATATQESTLRDLSTAVDHDSLGLFQQRPSCGWGTPTQLTDPTYAANAFLAAMTKAAPNYMHQPLWSSAQATQQSGYPTAYAKWENMAAQMTHAIATGQH
jgi:hypothetical protein